MQLVLQAEHIAGDEEEQQLAIEPAPQTALSMAVQMELDENGKLVPKAQSMVIQAQAQPLYRQVTEYNNVVNNNSFTKRMHSDRWNEQETDAFFAVRLSSCSLSPQPSNLILTLHSRLCSSGIVAYG